ncbi:MAG: putative 4-hydroxybenzoate polyprenyltransferase [Acidobacteria bacterium]|nr:putative 4-hydroxybenzoate polyprenyltransferase [Acidobacteriota bacterium]
MTDRPAFLVRPLDALARLRAYASLVRFSHTVFALPFALTGAMLAAVETPLTAARLGWIVAAMATARTAAMGFNRLADARSDALNPRTRNRELPRGRVSRREAAALVAVSSVAFVAVASRISALCLALSPVALGIVFWYSLAKRYTTWTQVFLGLALAVAPVGGWIAAGGGAGWEPWLLGIGTGTWVAGFDILYACQDVDFDRNQGLRSIPARFGVARALSISRAFHVLTVGSLAALAWVAPLGPVYLAGVAGVAALLAYEQSLVRPGDLSRVKQAFDLNGCVGVLYCIATAMAIHG